MKKQQKLTQLRYQQKLQLHVSTLKVQFEQFQYAHEKFVGTVDDEEQLEFV